jgi:hypothetical protein
MSTELVPVPPSDPVPAAPVLAEIIPLPVGRYAIPLEDTREGGRWEKITQRERDRINLFLFCFGQMEAAHTMVREVQALAFRFRHLNGYSEGNIIAAYYAWKKGGWYALVRKYKVNASPLPPEFLEHWRALCEQNGRSIIKAMEKLYRAWFAGEAIPGYGELQADRRTRAPGTWIDWWHRTRPEEDAPRTCPGTPEGWSKSTLYENGPTKIERTWATLGLAAVRTMLPSLIRDTGKLLPLQLLTMDDFETDQEVLALNPRTRQWQVTKVTGIAVMDVATRRIIAVLMKPRFKDEDGTLKAITRAEVRFLVYQVLRDYGIPATGMTFLVENAAAAITTELDLTLRNLFGGRVGVTRTGLIHDKVFSNGFMERGGKPWLKGWIESFFNLMHNEAAELPGQKGANYLVQPGDHAMKVQYTEHLIGQGERDARLTEAQIQRLQLPFKSSDELIAFYIDTIFARIENRVTHKMQGFEVLKRWRRSEHDTWHEWEEIGSTTPDEREMLQWFPREQRESSRMRWDRLFPQVTLERPAARVLAMLLLTPKLVKMRKTGVTLTHNGQGYSFADKRALQLRIPEGTEVLCYFDPYRPQWVHICDLEGRHLAELRSLKVDMTDVAAMDDASKHLSELYNSILSTIRNRPLHQEADRKQLEAKAHNASIVAEANGTRPPEEAAPAAPAPQPLSPVRAHLAKIAKGVTQTLARDQFAPRAAHTPVGEAMAETIIASAEERAAAADQARLAAEEEAARAERGAQQNVDDYT